MADGSLKNIEEVKAGDQVVSYDLKTGERVTDTVHKLLVHKANPEGFLVINNNLRVTPNHRMWVENKNAWLRADELSIGDKLLNPDGEPTIISTIEKIEGTNDVFNLSLPGKNHNYFADGVLVHNAYKI